MSNKQGPKLQITYSCESCSFYERQSNSPPTNDIYICNKLGKKLNYSIPDEKCPFKLLLIKYFLIHLIEI